MHTAKIIPFRFESCEVRTPHSAILRSRIIVISSRTLGEMLDCHNETYTYLRATGAVEHRAGDGVLLAISINGKNYMDRLIDPVPVRPGAVSTSRRGVEALPRMTRHNEVATMLGVSRRALERMVAAGSLIKPIKLTTRTLGRGKATLEKYLKERSKCARQ